MKSYQFSILAALAAQKAMGPVTDSPAGPVLVTNEYKAQGSAAITDARGLYFIDPKNEDPEKPTQIWTQGETEATSVYIPIIDKPNQKTTQEFNLTVPAQYVTLSNGKLVSQKKNTDGTRTDAWKMDQPHAFL